MGARGVQDGRGDLALEEVAGAVLSGTGAAWHKQRAAAAMARRRGMARRVRETLGVERRHYSVLKGGRYEGSLVT